MFILFRDATLQINCVTTKLMFDGTNCRGPTNAAASLDICWAGILKINSEIWTGLHLQHIHVNFYPPKGEFLSEFQIKEKEKQHVWRRLFKKLPKKTESRSHDQKLNDKLVFLDNRLQQNIWDFISIFNAFAISL